MKTDDARQASGSLLRLHSFAREIRKRVGSGTRILEIGAGDGQLAQALADEGHRVIAIDREQRSSFPTVVTTFESYDAGGVAFDCVAAALVLHHLSDLAATIDKIRSLLCPTGIVAIDDYGWERLDEGTARRRWGDAWQSELQTWKDERAELHRSDAMLHELDRAFTRLSYHDHPYFDDGEDTDALGFTYFGRPRVIG